jgi:parallel beta helix pectate lyase-like protein
MTRSRFVLSFALLLSSAGVPLLAQSAASHGIPDRVAALEDAVAALSAMAGGGTVNVDCAIGQSVNSALAQVSTTVGPVTINISGTCHEAVVVTRSRRVLHGVHSGDGIQAPSPLHTALRVTNAREVFVDNLTLSSGNVGLKLTLDASVRVTNSVVIGNFPYGVHVDSGFVNLTSTSVTGNGMGVLVWSGGHARINASTISGNSQPGVHVFSGGSALVDTGTVISGNHGGIVVWGGDLNVRTATIENNTGDGVQGVLGARLVLEPSALVQNNTGNGVRLGDTAVAGLVGMMRVINNGGWGVLCVGPPATAHYVAGPGVITGNAAGQVNCPTSPIFSFGG